MKTWASFSFLLLCGLATADASLPFQWRSERASKTGYYSAKAAYPVFSGDSGVARLANKALMEAAQNGVAQFVRESAVDEKPTNPYEFDRRITVTVAKRNLISTLATLYWYTGGAHPNAALVTANFGIVNGKPARFGWNDVVRDPSARIAMENQIIAKLKQASASWILDGSVTGLTPQQKDNFVVSPAGLTWYFSPYDMGPWVQGSFTIKFDWQELQGLVSLNGPLNPIRQR